MRDYIVFGEDWGRHPSSTQHIVRHLRAERVIWCNSIGLRRPSFTRGDIKRAADKLRSFRQPTITPATRGPSNITIVHPLAIPAARSVAGRTFNRVLLERQINRAMPGISNADPAVWISLPSAAPMARAFGRGPVIYYCGDDFTALAGVDHDTIAAYENELAAASDVIFAASPEIAKRFPNDKTLLLTHGVDADLFATPHPRPHDLPQGRPVAGFYGAIATWIDIDLILAAAKALPDWWIVLLGPLLTDGAALQAAPNVVLLGSKPHASLPGYVQHWDVSLIPFLDTPQISACNPLKLREYLAAGTPIVSTRFPALRPYEQLVHAVSGAADIAAAIRSARHDQARKAERQQSVAGETWASRSAYVEAILNGMNAGVSVSQLPRLQPEGNSRTDQAHPLSPDLERRLAPQ